MAARPASSIVPRFSLRPAQFADFDHPSSGYPYVPAPSPVPTPPAPITAPPRPPAPNVSEVDALIVAAALRWHDDPNLLLRVADCESTDNPRAYNRSGASGLFQFVPGTWASTYPQGDIWSAVDQAEAAAKKVAQGGLGAWSESQWCWA